MFSRRFAKVLRSYSASSSVHGISYAFGDDESIGTRIFWSAAVVLALASAAVWSGEAYKNWRENPVITTVGSMGVPIEKVGKRFLKD